MVSGGTIESPERRRDAYAKLADGETFGKVVLSTAAADG